VRDGPRGSMATLNRALRMLGEIERAGSPRLRPGRRGPSPTGRPMWWGGVRPPSRTIGVPTISLVYSQQH